MDNTEKTKRDAANAVAVGKVASEIGLTKQFVRAAVRGDRKSKTADYVVKLYNEKLAEIDKI